MGRRAKKARARLPRRWKLDCPLGRPAGRSMTGANRSPQLRRHPEATTVAFGRESLIALADQLGAGITETIHYRWRTEYSAFRILGRIRSNRTASAQLAVKSYSYSLQIVRLMYEGRREI